MKKIFDDIYAFNLPLPFAATPELTLYYIDDEKPALIDTGLGDFESIEIINSEFKKIDKSTQDIQYIINTHEHIEHFGGNRKIQKESNARIIASIAASSVIENFHKFTMDLKSKISEYDCKIANQFAGIIDFHLTIDDSKIDIQVNDGDCIDFGNLKLRVISTPGHVQGHISLYDEDRKILFTGDHIIATGSTFVGYGYREIVSQNVIDIFNNKYKEPDNISLYIESIKKLLELDIKIILPSHGAPITEPYKKLETEMKKKERRGQMFFKVLEKKKEIALKALTEEVYKEKNSSMLHRGAALGYLARLNKSGIIEANMKKDDLYLRMKES